MAILPPGVIDNSSKGVFEFSNNVIENIDATSIRYYSGKPSSITSLITIPKYAKRLIYGNKVKKVNGGGDCFV